MATLSKKDKARDYRLRRYYGISLDDYNRILQLQEGRCACCGREATTFRQSLAVEHSHTTGIIRGIVCNWCNRGLRYFQDDQSALTNAAIHLTRDYGKVPTEFLKGVPKKRRRRKKTK